MQLNEAVKRYIEKRVPVNKLVLLVNENQKVYQSFIETEEQPDYIETEYGNVKLKRLSYIDAPILIDVVEMLNVDGNKVVYK